MLGKEESVLGPLFAFNLGLEAGQILIIIATLLLFITLSLAINIKEKDKNFFLSSAVWGIAFIMTIERLSTLINS